MHRVNVEALAKALGDIPLSWYGQTFGRAYYRALEGQATLRALDMIAVTLGIHVSELMVEDYATLEDEPQGVLF